MPTKWIRSRDGRVPAVIFLDALVRAPNVQQMTGQTPFTNRVGFFYLIWRADHWFFTLFSSDSQIVMDVLNIKVDFLISAHSFSGEISYFVALDFVCVEEEDQ